MSAPPVLTAAQQTDIAINVLSTEVLAHFNHTNPRPPMKLFDDDGTFRNGDFCDCNCCVTLQQFLIAHRFRHRLQRAVIDSDAETIRESELPKQWGDLLHISPPVPSSSSSIPSSSSSSLPPSSSSASSLPPPPSVGYKGRALSDDERARRGKYTTPMKIRLSEAAAIPDPLIFASKRHEAYDWLRKEYKKSGANEKDAERMVTKCRKYAKLERKKLGIISSSSDESD